jgi:hypothetical protein
MAMTTGTVEQTLDCRDPSPKPVVSWRAAAVVSKGFGMSQPQLIVTNRHECHAAFGTEHKGCPLLGLGIASKHANPGHRQIAGRCQACRSGKWGRKPMCFREQVSGREASRRGLATWKSRGLNKKRHFLSSSGCWIKAGSHGDCPPANCGN